MQNEKSGSSSSSNIRWHGGEVSAADRRGVLGHGAATLWFTGLSGSGKSTVAVALEKRLIAAGVAAYRLDGDNLRHGLCGDLGFGEADRAQNVRRAGEAARLMADAGLIVLVSLISPFRSGRQLVRDSHTSAGLPFFEVFVDTPLAECERRDPKGLYAKARRGEIGQMTGLSSPYEPPISPELHLHPGQEDVDACVDRCLHLLLGRGIIESL